MSEVQFENDQTLGAPSFTPSPSKADFWVSLVLKTGLAKTDEGAQKVLLGTAIALFILAVLIFFMLGRGPEIQQFEDLPLQERIEIQSSGNFR